jgi:hypothetical protein
MPLSGDTFEKLHAALLSAFDEPGLQRMVAFGMNKNLAAITSRGALSEIIFQLIQWADREGCLDELIDAAARANPGNPALKAFVGSYRQAPSPAAARAPSPVPAAPPARAVDTRALREFIVARFSESDLAILCADLEDDLLKAGQPQRIDLEIVGGSDKHGKVLNLIRHLENRQLLAYLVDAVRKARPDFPG